MSRETSGGRCAVQLLKRAESPKLIPLIELAKFQPNRAMKGLITNRSNNEAATQGKDIKVRAQ